MTHQKIFQERLAQIRRLKNWSQETLADKSGFKPSAISHFEGGRRTPSFKNLIKLAKTLNVSLDYLIGLEMCGLICSQVWATAENWPKIRKLEKELRKK